MLRKMLLPCENFSAYPLATSRRLLRRKRAVADYDTNQAPTAEVPSLRAGGMPAAPDTSLDKIRKEILLMRAEKSKRGGGSLDNAPSAPHAEGQLKHVDWDMWLDKIRPNEAYYKGSDVLHCVEAKDCVAKLQFFLDAHEVLRGKTEENTLRYMQAVYGAIGSAHRQDVKEYVDGLLGMVDREVQQINECLQPSTCADYSSAEKSGCALVEDTKRMAWVNTLTRMTDDEIRKLWKLGILDFDTIEHLALADATFPEDGETCEGAPAGSISDERCARRSENDSMETNDEFSTALPIEENIGILKDVRGVDELTSVVSESVFMGIPTIDLAPVTQKVRRKQYEDISERELKLLECYEEAKHTIEVLPGTLAPSEAPNNNNSCDDVHAGPAAGADDPKLSGSSERRGLENGDVAGPGHVPPAGTCIPFRGKESQLRHLNVTEAMINRVLCPSNRFLHALAKLDAKLHNSLEAMERIKRRTLLDPVFQAAVEEVHACEEVPTQPCLSRNITGIGDKAYQGRRRRPRVTSGGAPIVCGPFGKGRHAADIPYFYGNIYSFVPPRGHYNVPPPRMPGKGGARQRRFDKSRKRYSQ